MFHAPTLLKVRAVKSLLRRTTEMADALTALHGDLSYGPMHKDWPAFLDAVQPLLGWSHTHTVMGS